MDRWLSCLAGALTVLLLLPSRTFAGPPFRTDDPEPVDFQHFEINMISLGTETSTGWNGVLPELEINYGGLPNLQLHAIVPQDYTAQAGGRTGFNVGTTYDFSTNWHLLSSVGSGIQNTFGTNQFSYFLALQLTF